MAEVTDAVNGVDTGSSSRAAGSSSAGTAGSAAASSASGIPDRLRKQDRPEKLGEDEAPPFDADAT
jgi:sec-independent protein translocase protein TatB